MWNSVISIWKRWINPIWTDRVWGGVILAAILALIAAIYGHLSGSTAHLFAGLGDTVTISRWQLPAEFAGGGIAGSRWSVPVAKTNTTED
jgi:hypothetical protein